MVRKRKPENQVGRGGAPVAPVPAKTVSSSRDAGLASGGGPTPERVRERAREIYERRTALGLPGDAESDWLQAEAELGAKKATKP